MQLSELIERLQELASELGDENPEVLLAHQPQWPFEYHIGEIVLPEQPRRVTKEEFDALSEEEQEQCEQDAEDGLVEYVEDGAELPARCVFIAEAGQKGYLTGGVSKLLGWR